MIIVVVDSRRLSKQHHVAGMSSLSGRGKLVRVYEKTDLRQWQLKKELPLMTATDGTMKTLPLPVWWFGKIKGNKVLNRN